MAQAQKKKVLVTGANGFVGRNTLPVLQESFEVLAPERAELNLLEADAVRAYVTANKPDLILHLANPNPSKNALDEGVEMFRGSMDAFMSVYRCAELVERIVYLGSGAEYDKRYEICTITEEEFGRSYPKDPYGAAKYIQNELANAEENVINLRLFACFGPHDHWTKFITHCVRSLIAQKDITIRQDCYFDYIHVSDFAQVIAWALSTDTACKDYNIASGKRYLLSEIAAITKDCMGAPQSIKVLSEGLNREYTPSIERLRTEYKAPFKTLAEGIKEQIAWEKSVWPAEGYLEL